MRKPEKTGKISRRKIRKINYRDLMSIFVFFFNETPSLNKIEYILCKTELNRDCRTVMRHPVRIVVTTLYDRRGFSRRIIVASPYASTYRSHRQARSSRRTSSARVCRGWGRSRRSSPRRRRIGRTHRTSTPLRTRATAGGEPLRSCDDRPRRRLDVIGV